jgi:hypothetical protein
MQQQAGLDLDRVDILSAADDHVLQAAGNAHVTALIQRPRSPVRSHPSGVTA